MIFLHDAPATSFCQASSGLQCFFMEIFGNLAQKGSFVEVVVWYLQYTTNLTNSLNEVAKRPNCFLDTGPKTELEKLLFFFIWMIFLFLSFFGFYLPVSHCITRAFAFTFYQVVEIQSLQHSRMCDTVPTPPRLDYLPLCPIAIFPLSMFLFILLFYAVRLPFVSIMGDSKMFSFSFSGVQAMCFEFDVYFVVCRTIIKRKKTEKNLLFYDLTIEKSGFVFFSILIFCGYAVFTS